MKEKRLEWKWEQKQSYRVRRVLETGGINTKIWEFTVFLTEYRLRKNQWSSLEEEDIWEKIASLSPTDREVVRGLLGRYVQMICANGTKCWLHSVPKHTNMQEKDTAHSLYKDIKNCLGTIHGWSTVWGEYRLPSVKKILKGVFGKWLHWSLNGITIKKRWSIELDKLMYCLVLCWFSRKL